MLARVCTSRESGLMIYFWRYQVHLRFLVSNGCWHKSRAQWVSETASVPCLDYNQLKTKKVCLHKSRIQWVSEITLFTRFDTIRLDLCFRWR